MPQNTKPGAFVLKISPSKTDRVPEALASNELIIGWSEAQNLTDTSLTRQQFRQIIHQTYHNGSGSLREAGMGAGTMWRFIRVMKPGDLVVVPHRNDFYIARITGAAYHDPGLVVNDTAHRRPVRWLNPDEPLPRVSAPPELQARMSSRLACVRADDLLSQILALPLDWSAARSTPSASDVGEAIPAARALTETYRILRDTELARAMKDKHRDRCQLCGFVITLPDGTTYSEAHHIQPLGRPHNGPDTAENILVLCPNHHAMYDYGALKLRRSDLVVHRDHHIGEQFIRYHNDVIAAGAP